jgi:hypothetical protein
MGGADHLSPVNAETKPFDSREDTMAHIARVRELIRDAVIRLRNRAKLHDLSKLKSPEKEAFDALGDNLRGITYGSDEYRAQLKKIKPAIQHHYDHNTHHPEHYQYEECNICFHRHHRNYVGQCERCGNGIFTTRPGIEGMSLLDLLEMLCDWKAAGERHADGSIARSIEVNENRFFFSPQITQILRNTALELGWMPKQ